MKFTVKEPCGLLEFLFGNLDDKSRTTVKSFLTHRQVSVNNTITTQFDAKLREGDVVTIREERGPEPFRHPMMRIVYEDKHIVVIDKKSGLLSIGTDKERTRTAYYILSEHVKLSDPRNRIFIVHRLDRETSGLMVFARSEEVQSAFQRNWSDTIDDRRYVAVIEGALPQDAGEISAPLSENSNFKVYVSPDGEPAVTRYTVLKKGRELSLVELELETGRKNQIRAHMEHMKTPIVGDKKYGATRNDIGRVCLHARVLSFRHLVTGEQLTFSTPIPYQFEKIVK